MVVMLLCGEANEDMNSVKIKLMIQVPTMSTTFPFISETVYTKLSRKIQRSVGIVEDVLHEEIENA